MNQPNHFEVKKNNTQKRHQMVREKVNEVYAQKVDGLRLDLDDVIARVADNFGYSTRTVRNIIKAA